MIGPKRPLPRQSLVAGLVLYGDTGVHEVGVILEVRQVTQVRLEDGRKLIIGDDGPVPIVADQLPDPPPEPSELIVPVDADADAEVDAEDPPA